MTERPPNEDNDIDEQYLRASARDASGPSEAVRRAILRHAAELATQRAVEGAAPQGISDQNAPGGAQRSAEIGSVPPYFKQPAANEARWRPAAYGGLAAAALAGLLIAPHFLPASRTPTAAPSQAVLSASNKTEAAPTARFDVPEPPAMPARIPSPGAAGSAATDSTVAPHGQAPAVGGKPRAFANEASLDKARDALFGVDAHSAAPPDSPPPASAPAPGVPSAPAPSAPAPSAAAPPPSAPSTQIAGVQRAFTVPPAQAVASGSVSAHTAMRALAPTDSAAALRQAAQGGDTSRLKALLDEQIDLDARDSAGRTALMLAVIGGQAQAVDTLLARGADPNAADSSGTTPLAAALAANHADIASALRRAGAH